jgi:ribosomal protein L40E
MSYCHNCGAKLPEDAVYCSKCGTKAALTGGGGSVTPSDEMREAFTRVSAEMEKAFSIAAREVHDAFQVARNNLEKSMNKVPVVCSNCGEKNPASASYCFKCGKSLSVTQASKPKDSA